MVAILRSFVFLMALVCIGSFLANSADAQVARAVTRHLALGYGQGYHKATPLTDPSYYNPYSPSNSNYFAGGPAHYSNGNYGNGSQFHNGSIYSGDSSFGGYSGWTSAQASFYPGVRFSKSFIDRPLPKWHGHTRSNLIGM